MERLRRYLLRYQIVLVWGDKSRCIVSISSCEQRHDGSYLLSINRDLYGPPALEAAAYQIALIMVGLSGRRVRLSGRASARWDQQRAWWKAAEITIPDEAHLLGRARSWEDADMVEYYGVTWRLLQARKETWQRKLGALFAAAPLPYERSISAVPSLWCEIL